MNNKLALDALDKLARLGNGDCIGNSTGNTIAAQAAAEIRAALEAVQVEPKDYTGLIRALRDQEQCDESGERCSVSRQAVDEAIAIIEAVQVEPSSNLHLSELMRGLELPPSLAAGKPMQLFAIGQTIATQAKENTASTVQVEPVATDVLEQTQILRDSADRLTDSGYSATGAEIRMAAKAIEVAITKAPI